MCLGSQEGSGDFWGAATEVLHEQDWPRADIADTPGLKALDLVHCPRIAGRKNRDNPWWEWHTLASLEPYFQEEGTAA